MTKFVTIYRRESAAKLPQEIKDAAIKKLSAGITSSGIPLKGISIEEEEKLLPSIVGLPASHVEFANKVNNWYNNLSKPVDKNGIKLNIAVSEKTGMPEVPIDFLLYKRALVDRLVAKSKTEMMQDQRYSFFINDENEELSKKLDILKEKENAQREYFKVKDSETLTDALLQVFAQSEGHKTTKYTSLPVDEKTLVLDRMLTSMPKVFLEMATDKDLEIRAEILAMVDYQVLTRVGNKFINGTEPIGDSLEEVIAYFKSAKNQTEYIKFKAKMDNLGYKTIKTKKVKDAN